MRLVMYVVVNKDLTMSPGKVSAQVGHAVLDYVLAEGKQGRDLIPWLTDYKKGGDTICVLKASESKLKEFQEMGYVTVVDRGYTEIPQNSLTVVNLGIYDREKEDEIPKFLRRLRTL